MIELAWARIDEPVAETLIRRLAQKSDHDYAARYRNRARRRESLLARAILRGLLAIKSDISPDRWRLPGLNSEGRRVAGVYQSDLTWFVSSAHSQGSVVAAVSDISAIGVDLEDCTRIRNYKRLLRGISHPGSAFRSVGRENFYKIWTLHEAHGKARGVGLEFPIQKELWDVADLINDGTVLAKNIAGNDCSFLTGRINELRYSICQL